MDVKTLCSVTDATMDLLSVARELHVNNDAIFERKSWKFLRKQITVGVSGKMVMFYDFKPNTATPWTPTLHDLAANDYVRVM